MEQNIEVEVRGLLSHEEYERVEAFFAEKGTFLEEKHRLLIDYSTFLPSEGIRDRKKDIRVRVTNGIPEIVVKLGSWGGSESRKELSFKGKEGSFNTLVEIFGHLGLTKGILAKRNTQVYMYKNIEFALVEVPGHSYYFEAEKMANSTEDLERIEAEIREVCRELGLDILEQEGFFAYIEKLNAEANSIFDANEFPDSDYKDIFVV